MFDNSNHHETVNGFHLFKIKRYSAIKDVGPGRHISSNTFNVGGYTWALYFYPHGKYMEDKSKYVSLFVVLSSYGKHVEASFELTLLDQSEKRIHMGCSTPFTTLNSRGSMWGCLKLMRRSKLESSCFLKDDSLSICCKVEVVRSSCIAETNKTFTMSLSAQSEMEADIRYLLDTETGCDIVFRVKSDRFKAHKLILAARSPVFRAQFYGLVANPDLGEVDLKEIEPSIFKAMLSYIYSNKLPEFEEIMDTVTMSTSTNFIQHLLVAADRFGVDPLMKLCEAKLCEELNVDAWGTTLLLAYHHHCSQLKAFCLKFAKANLRAVMETEGYKDIQEACPSLLADLLQVIALES